MNIEECEETDELLQTNQNEDSGLDAKLKKSILSLLKSEFETFKKDTQGNRGADIESIFNWKEEVTTKLEELHGSEKEDSEVQSETNGTNNIEADVEENVEEILEFSVKEDVFSIMIFSPFCSLMYWIGIFTFFFQILLLKMLYEDLTHRGVAKDIPFGVDSFVRNGQYLVAFLSIAFQTDIHDAVHYFLLLRKGNQTNWKILADNQASPQEVCDLLFIMRSVYIPNLLRFCQGCLTLRIVPIIIQRNDDLIDLLMNFAAIYIVSEIDNVIFKLIRKGFCPCFRIVKVAARIEDVKFFRRYKSNERCGWKRICNSLTVRSLVLVVPSLYLLLKVAELQWKQDNGYILREVYRKCYVDRPSLIGDGGCNGGEYNTKECGWDGGDCIVNGYPDCHVDDPSWIGNGWCYGEKYNTEECGWEGEDCNYENQILWAKYPNCNKGVRPDRIGDGRCHGGKYNTEACGWDGGDCNEGNQILWEKYPNCNKGVYPPWIGDGRCDGEEYNTEECGWDDGDCNEFNRNYPDCTVDYPSWIGDGICNGEYNTEACGWDGGDCH